MKAFMNATLKVFKSVIDPDKRLVYHFMASFSRIEWNILHIKESLWLYKAMAFLCNIM